MKILHDCTVHFYDNVEEKKQLQVIDLDEDIQHYTWLTTLPNNTVIEYDNINNEHKLIHCWYSNTYIIKLYN